MTEITHILNSLAAGSAASDRLLPLVYQELRDLAQARLRHERANSVDATELVHDAYLRLVESDQAVAWESRGHFFGAAAEAMRRLLVERARKRNALKRGGDRQQVPLEGLTLAGVEQDDKLLQLSEAIDKLESIEPERAQLVKLRYFASFTVAEAAEILGVSKSAAERSWAFTRAWLQKEMTQ